MGKCNNRMDRFGVFGRYPTVNIGLLPDFVEFSGFGANHMGEYNNKMDRFGIFEEYLPDNVGFLPDFGGLGRFGGFGANCVGECNYEMDRVDFVNNKKIK